MSGQGATGSLRQPDTLAAALRAATARLANAGLDGAPQDARRLLAHAARLAPDRLTLHLPDPMPPEAVARLEAALDARIARQPVSRIIGRREFWGRAFAVTPDVLDPRPETETLVALALDAPFTRLLDLGTGAGVLAISLLAERPGATGLATDLSEAALATARTNAESHGVAPRLAFTQADWFNGVTGSFDLIVSNPPYIPAADIAGLAPEVRDHDPEIALTDGGDGLAAYRQIAAGAGAHLAPGGRLLVETGAGDGGAQARAVAALFTAAGLTGAALHDDLSGRSRVVSARF
ncbi:MAG: peptide chain release factor N(5)-glutamine methyltransferase [Pseudomonadota bacterium]